MADKRTIKNDLLESIIDDMESCRRRNNVNWMDLLRLACKYAPHEELIEVLTSINRMDRDIQDRWPDIIDALDEEE